MKAFAVLTTLVVMVFCMVTGLSTDAAAGAKTVEIEGVGYNVAHSMSENLSALKGKTVYVTLSSGTQIGGTVKDVNNSLLHLEKVVNKDFFDALIRVDSIVAVNMRFRKYER
jgi:small nuclear ribonucleoprotein (snRNP)-like protein